MISRTRLYSKKKCGVQRGCLSLQTFEVCRYTYISSSGPANISWIYWEMSPTLTNQPSPINDSIKGEVSSSPQVPEQVSHSPADVSPLPEPSNSMELKRSSRPSKPPVWLHDYVTIPVCNSYAYPISSYVTYSHLKPLYQHVLALHSAVYKLKTFREAVSDSKWVQEMKQEVVALEDNNTWAIVDFPPDKAPIGCKWIFKVKYRASGEIERYKPELVPKRIQSEKGSRLHWDFLPCD